MAILDFFKHIGKKDDGAYTHARFLNGEAVFNDFGKSIYASDVVQNCIDVIATECSKLQPRHIRTSAEGIQTYPKSSINRLFRVSPNPLMTTSQFLEKVIWLLYLNYNCFIYPMYTIYKDKHGIFRKRFTAFYPLDPQEVQFEKNAKGELFIHFYFGNKDFILPYGDVIHLRKKFGMNDVMGGGLDGAPDNEALLKVLETNDIINQGMGKVIKTSLAVRLVMKINTMLDDDKKKAERKKFETALTEGDSSILPMDVKGDVHEIKVDPKLIDKDTMEFLDQKVLRWFGVSLPIITGKFNDEEYQAFYEKTLEPLVISLGQAFTKCLYSERELDVGNEMVFYQKNMMYLSTSAKMTILKTAGEQGLLTDDQKLGLLGLPPIGGEAGARRTQSLNYVDVLLVNDYQMSKANAPQVNLEGGSKGE